MDRNLELENWQLKAELLQLQQRLLHYQAREVEANLKRLAPPPVSGPLPVSTPLSDLAAPQSSAHN